MTPDIRAEGFESPGPGDFDLPPVFGDTVLFAKPAILLVLAAIIVFLGLYLTARRAALVPSKAQYAGEEAYSFVRNGVARDIIGSHEFMKYVPLLVSLFFFVLVNNLFGIIPLIQFPTFAHYGFAYALAGMSWLLYNYLGVRKHGFGGYLKHVSVPPDVPKVMLPLLIPLEFLSNIIVRPITLSLRLASNMFAGHLLLLLFTLGGEYLLLHADNAAYKPVGVITFILAILISFLEVLVQFLQAYVFTLLTAMYIQGALAEEH